MHILNILVSMLCMIGIVNGKNFKTVNADEFAKIISKKNVVVVDVRTHEEFEQSHIADAVNFDVQTDFFLKAMKGQVSRKATVLVYCRSGVRSRQAAEILTEAGYMVINLDKGIQGWLEAGYQVTKKTGEVKMPKVKAQVGAKAAEKAEAKRAKEAEKISRPIKEKKSKGKK